MPSPDPKVSDLKRYLAARSQAELAKEIAELFKKIPAVKDYYQLKLNPRAEIEVLEKYKKTIRKEFATDPYPGQARLSVARKAVMDFKKITSSPASIADMMLFYVEQGVAYTNAFGDIDEPFYNSMESMYQTAAQWTAKHQLTDLFDRRFRLVLSETQHMGWGFPDALNDIYQEFLANAEG